MDVEVYTVLEVSRKLRVNKNYVYDLINSGLLKARRVGSLKVSHLELADFIRRTEGKDLSDFKDIKDLDLSMLNITE
jgi:excisionase family DNA binding protein